MNNSNRHYEINKLHQPSSVKMIGFIGIDFLLISLLFLIALWSESFWVSVLCAFLMIRGQIGPLVIAHDIVHGALLKSKKTSCWFAQIFLTTPFFVDVHTYWNKHKHHHLYAHSEKDPDLKLIGHYPVPQEKFIKNFFGFLTGYYAFLNASWYLRNVFLIFLVGDLKSKKWKGMSFYIEQRACYFIFLWQVILITLAVAWGRIDVYFIVWLIPNMTLVKACHFIRGLGEHSGMPLRAPIDKCTRTMTGFFANIFMLPHNIGYHTAHHLFPRVPFYNLKKLHYFLISQKVICKSCERKSYFLVLKELMI